MWAPGGLRPRRAELASAEPLEPVEGGHAPRCDRRRPPEGRARTGPVRTLPRARFRDLARRLGLRGLDIRRNPRKPRPRCPTRRRDEAAAITRSVPETLSSVALDERGKTLDSDGFRQAARPLARRIGGERCIRDRRRGRTSPELRRTMKLTIAFGAATWPHQMVRIMLLEQIYRATTILAGHPYHRA